MNDEYTYKRGRPKQQERSCVCGYMSTQISHLKRHKATCHVVLKYSNVNFMTDKNAEIERLSQQLAKKDDQLAAKDEQLAAKDEQLAVKDSQIAEKDEQIKQLIKRPRTVTHNNRFVVKSNVNCFGRETLCHIPDAKYQELLRDPETSVAKVVALQRAVAENENVIVPNVRDRRWLVVEEEDAVDDLSLRMAVFPNPASEEVRFVLHARSLVEVRDATGRMAWAGTLAGGAQRMDVTTWPAGVYTLTVSQDVAQGATHVARFTVQR